MAVDLQDLQTNQTQKEMSFRDLISKFIMAFKYLLSKWKTIFIFCLIGGVIGLSYAYLKKPEYISTTTFVLEGGEGSSSLSQYAGIASMVGIDMGSGGGIFQGDNIIELYKSRTMLEKTLLSYVDGKSGLLLIDRYINITEMNKRWDEKPELKNLRFYHNNVAIPEYSQHQKRVRDSIIRDVCLEINKEFLSVSKPDKKLSIIYVGVRSKDELFAKVFNEELVKNVNEFYIQTKTKKSLANVAILNQKVDSVRKVMNGEIYRAVVVNDATPNLNPTRSVQRVAPMQRSQFTIETNKAMLSELIKNLELSKLSLLKEAPLIQIIDNPILPLEKKKVSKVFNTLKMGALFGLIAICYLILRKLTDSNIDIVQ